MKKTKFFTAIIAVMLLAMFSSCDHINSKAVPSFIVRIDLGNLAMWNTYGVNGIGDYRVFNRDKGIPANFPYNVNTYTGFGGVLLMMGLDGPMAYDLACPVESSQSVTLSIDPENFEAFCPKCGSPRFVEHNDKSKHCEACGFTYYINPSAATVALIERPACQPLPSLTGGVGGGSVEWLCVRRAKEPAKGTLDLPGGFSDLYETSEEGVIREVKEETGLSVARSRYLFSIPNTYLYSGMLIPTLDLFFDCEVDDIADLKAGDDAAECFWMAPEEILLADFGLDSIREGVKRWLEGQL